MTYLEQQNRVVAGDDCYDPTLDAKGKRVIILGGGDTGADCLGTAHRQGAANVRQFEIAPRPPDSRSPSDPWPQWPNIYRVSAAHEEGGDREYAVMTTHLEGENGVLKRLHGVRVEMVRKDNGQLAFEPVPGTEFSEDVDLIFLAMGFSGPEPLPLFTQLGVDCDAAGRVKADPVTRQTVRARRIRRRRRPSWRLAHRLGDRRGATGRRADGALSRERGTRNVERRRWTQKVESSG